MGKKLALITGSSTGIGFSTVKKFIKNDWNVIAHYYEENENFSTYFSSLDVENEMVKVDFGDESELYNFLSYIDNLNQLDALVNCAGCFDFSLKAKNRIKSINNIFQINSIAPALMAERSLEVMKRNNSGSIVNISSIGVKYGSNLSNMFYSASKSALEATTRTLAREGAPHNVMVNSIRPGIVNTEFYDKIGKDITERIKMIPVKRAADPEEIADLIYYLCSTNRFITSQIIPISGGE